MANNIVEKGNKYIFNGVYMEVYIPEYYFNNGKYAYFDGDKVHVFGVFNFKIFSNEKQEFGDVKTLNTWKFPAFMVTQPSSYHKKEMELIPGISSVQKYYVLKYFNNDIFVVNTDIIKSIDNNEAYVDMITTGKIPNTIKYDDHVDIWIKNNKINGFDPNVSGVLLEAILAEVNRYNQDLAIPFRKIIGKNPNTNPYMYKPADSRTICSYSSTTAAVTFEDIDTMLTTSINKKRYNKEESYTPVEKIIRV